jgi:hypothetical protein
MRLETQTRRAELIAAGKCLNGPLVGNVGRGGVVHGPVVRGDKRQRCFDLYKKTAGGYADYPHVRVYAA